MPKIPETTIVSANLASLNVADLTNPPNASNASAVRIHDALGVAREAGASVGSRQARQTCEGSFLSVSTPIFAFKYAF